MFRLFPVHAMWVLFLVTAGLPSAVSQTPGNQNQAARGIRLTPQPDVPHPSVHAGRKDYAILFAGNHYDSWKALSNPIPDAEALQQEMEQHYGFKTELVKDPTLEDVIRVLGEWRERNFDEQDQLLIFFAGHGIFDDTSKEGFLVTRDSDISDPAHSRYLPYSRLREMVDSLPAKHVFLVIDACFGGTIDRRIAEAGGRGDNQYALLSLPELVSRKAALTTRQFLSSGGKEYVPDGAPGHHSPFTAQFLAALRTYGGQRGFLTINSILADVEPVKPQPVWGDWGRNEPGSDFLFIPLELKARLSNPTDPIFAPRVSREIGSELSDIVPRRSVAVLGFRNSAQRQDRAWLSGAVADALANELASGGQLRTVSQENVARLKSDLHLSDNTSYAAETLRQIYDRTGSDYVISGSYLSLGDQVRLNISLQDTFRGEVSAAVEESGAESELVSMLSRAGAELRYKLGLTAQSPDQLQPLLPANPEAARLYSEGRQRMQVYDAVSARELLERALVIDPDFALTHYLLSDVWSFIGYDRKAQEEAKKAFDLSAGMPRETKLLIEARYWATVPNWDKAIDTYKSLWTLYPDNLDYGLELARTQVAAEHGTEAMNTISALRKLPRPLSDDPRIDIAEADAALAVSAFAHQKLASERALGKAEKLNARQLQAEALWFESVALRHLGENQKALDACSRGASAAHEFANRRLEARFLTCIGNIQSDSGNYDAAINSKQQALKLAAAAGAKRDVAGALANIANMLYTHAGDLKLARDYYQQAITVSNDIADLAGVALTQLNLASLLSTIGEYSKSREVFESAERISYELKDDLTAAAAAAGIAQTFLVQGDLQNAEQKVRDSLKAVRASGSKSDLASDLALLGDVLLEQDKMAEAEKAYSKSLQLRHELGESGSVASTKLALSILFFEQHDLAKSEAMAKESLLEFHTEKDSDNEALARATLAKVLLEERKVGEALDTIGPAQGSRIQDQTIDLTFRITAARALATRDPASAIAELNDAIEIAKRLGLAPLQFQGEIIRAEITRDNGNAASANIDLTLVKKEAADRGLNLIAGTAAGLLK